MAFMKDLPLEETDAEVMTRTCGDCIKMPTVC